MKKFSKILIFFILIIQIFNLNCLANTKDQENFITDFKSESTDLEINSGAAILVEQNTGIVVYEKNANEKMYPASTTKIMTAILVLENCKLTDTVTVHSSALTAIPSSYVVAGIYDGEEFTVEDLLYALMLKSANDVAVVFAEHVSGSVENFSELMNQKAKEIGCTNTNFVNPNGIHNENHYSTAYDLALIAKYCMKNETFRKIVSTTEYTLPRTNKYNFADRSFKNTNELLLKDGKYYYENANGIKTGYTKEAKSCLIASSSKDDISFISVVLGSSSTTNGKDARFSDTINLFDYGFNNFKFTEFKKESEIITKIEIENATKETKELNLKVQDALTSFSNSNFDFEDLKPNIQLNENISAPISKNDVLGTVSYEVQGITYKANLLANSDVEKQTYYLLIIGIGIVILFVGILILILRKKSRQKKITNKKHRQRVRK